MQIQALKLAEHFAIPFNAKLKSFHDMQEIRKEVETERKSSF